MRGHLAAQSSSPRPDAFGARPSPTNRRRRVSVQNVAVTADEAGHARRSLPGATFPGLELLPYPARHPQRRGARQRQAHPAEEPPGSGTNRAHPAAAARCAASRGRPGNEADAKTRDFLRSITLHEDADVLVLNKPMGLAVQGGSGTTRHLDGMLEVLRDAHGQRPRLVHRLDKDTAGCLLVAKTRFAAAALAKTFRSRSARKIYWALVAGVPKVQQGRISTFLAKEEREDEFVHAHRPPRRKRRKPRGDLLRGGGDRRAAVGVAVAQAGDRPHPSTARAHGAYRPSDRRRSEIFFDGELAIARRHAEQAASARPPHCRAASARRHHRCQRAVAAAHAAILEPARLRRQALRSDREAPEE